MPITGRHQRLPRDGAAVSEKNRLKPWQTERFCIPEADRPRFVAHMERVLDVYCEEFDDEHPLICMDEAAKQIVSDVDPALPMAPGRSRREDHHYERQGVRVLFLFFDPLRGWRRVSSRENRMRGDWAEEIQQLLDEDYPHAKLVTLVCDNLNIHDIASLYATFDTATAHRLARRLRIIHTPRNGSWLNLAEVERSILTRQCIGRRFDNSDQMTHSIAAWQQRRNQTSHGAHWRFTTADARIKLRTLYPSHDN